MINPLKLFIILSKLEILMISTVVKSDKKKEKEPRMIKMKMRLIKSMKIKMMIFKIKMSMKLTQIILLIQLNF